MVFLFSLAQREGKTIGVQMDSSPYSWMIPLPSSPPPSLHPSFPGRFRKGRTVERTAIG